MTQFHVSTSGPYGLLVSFCSNLEIFSVFNPELAINLTQETFNTEYAFTDAVSNLTETWTCNLEDDLNNVSHTKTNKWSVFQ